jgi:acyl carrier protein
LRNGAITVTLCGQKSCCIDLRDACSPRLSIPRLNEEPEKEESGMGLFSKIKKSLGGGNKTESSAPNPVAASEPPAAPPTHRDATEASAQSSPADSSATLEALKAKIAELSNGQISAEAVDPRAILFDFGYVDSLSAVTLISFIEETYSVSISELDLVGSLNTLESLSDHVGRLTA